MVSASLDQTVRVWDISGLRKKTVAPGGDDVLRLPQVCRRHLSNLSGHASCIHDGNGRIRTLGGSQTIFCSTLSRAACKLGLAKLDLTAMLTDNAECR